MRLRCSPPLDAAGLLQALTAHAVGGLEATEVVGRKHVRAVRGPSGPAVLSLDIGEADLVLELDAGERSDLEWLARRAVRWFDLDANPWEIYDALQGDPLIGPLVAARPGLRILGFPSGFEAAVLTVLGQQVSLAAARTFGSRLVRAFGQPVRNGFHAFPTPADLTSVSASRLQEVVGVTGARARTVLALSAAFAGGLDLDASADPVRAREELLALPGIGPWTADYLALRALGDRDAFPAGDLVLQRALGVRSSREAEQRAQPWRPYRAYAVFHLWTQAAYG